MTSFFLAFEAFEHDISEFLTKICENGKLKFAGCWVDAHCANVSSNLREEVKNLNAGRSPRVQLV